VSRTHARVDGLDVRRAARASGERRAAAVSVVVGDSIHGRGAEWGQKSHEARVTWASSITTRDYARAVVRRRPSPWVRLP
jgi:hypothetical protein